MPTFPFTHNRLTRRLDVLVKGRLWLQVLIALALGIGAGLMLGPDLGLVTPETAETVGDWLALPGKLFLALIRMVIIPLAVSSIILGMAGGGGGETLKLVGRRLAFFILVTTIAATAIGASLAQIVRPGQDVAGQDVTGGFEPMPRAKPDLGAADGAAAASPLQEMTRGLPDLITNLITQNITAAILEQDMLAIVIFALLIGTAVIAADKRELTRPLVALAEAVLEVCMTVIRTAMRVAPLAVFGLMAEATAANGLKTLADLVLYCGVVLAGLSLLLVLYLIIVTLFGRISPTAFLKAAGPVQLLAFSTSSSAAVMPLTMKTAVEQLRVPAPLAGAIIPLASTVNMAGTALYQAVAVVFLADIGGVSLSVGDLALIMITLTGASIGAPAAPGASIAILSATAASFGVPLTGLSLVVGVDRILDMARTAVNVTGDLVLCRVLSPHHEPVPDRPVMSQEEPAAPSP